MAVLEYKRYSWHCDECDQYNDGYQDASAAYDDFQVHLLEECPDD